LISLLSTIGTLVKGCPAISLCPDLVPFLRNLSHAHDLVFPTTKELHVFEALCERRRNKDTQLSSQDAMYLEEFDRNETVFNQTYALARTNRILFATGIGMLGLGPACLQPGDQIWLVKDSRMLWTVRPRQGEGFMLLGETYLAGCMNGEYVDCAEEKWEDLKLV
jgi:hypothetical protein